MVTIQPRTATVTIYGGDYLDRIRHLERRAIAAAEAEKNGPPRLIGEVPESHQLAEEHDELVVEAEQQATHVTVQALGRRRSPTGRPAWRDLVSDHPPRTSDDTGATEEQIKSDDDVGVNEDTFKDELVATSIIDPEFSSRAACDEFTDSLSDVDFDRIYLTAFSLNRMVAADPKASLVSRLNQPNGET